jgi:sulfate adenylyltransferase
LIEPHGKVLVNRWVKDVAKQERLLRDAQRLPQIPLEEEQVKDLQNIADGAYSPLTGFLCRHDFLKVANDMTLEDGTVWTLPIILPVTQVVAESLKEGTSIALSDTSGRLLAVMELAEIYDYGQAAAAEKLYGTDDPAHPGVEAFLEGGKVHLGGDITMLQRGFTVFSNYQLAPIETRVLFEQKGWQRIVGFQTRNPPHRGHEYLQKSALEGADGLLIHPKIGRKKAGDFRDDVILKSYEVLIEDYFPKDRVVMSILPAVMRYMGPREAVFDAIVRKNYGCTHFIVGRDHAGVGDFYDSFAAHKIFSQIDGIGIEPLFFDFAFYCTRCGGMVSGKTCPHSKAERINPSGTKIRSLLEAGEPPPAEMMRPEVARTILKYNDPFVR